jgi:hypothetical protein
MNMGTMRMTDRLAVHSVLIRKKYYYGVSLPI